MTTWNVYPADRLALAARWVLPGDRPPIEDGFVVVEGARIREVGRRPKHQTHGPTGYPVVDFGDAVIAPSLINAHTHLDLSDCREPIPVPGGSFAAWVEAVVAHRRSRGGYLPEVLQRGLAECFRFGVLAIGDIAQPSCSVADYCFELSGQLRPIANYPAGGTKQSDRGASTPSKQAVDWAGGIGPSSSHCCGLLRPKGVAFLEVIAPLAEKFSDAIGSVESFLAQDWRKELSPGLAPHAPYTVHPDVFRALTKLAADQGLPVAFHLAESADEAELLRRGEGPLRRLLETRGLWSPNLVRDMSSMTYLELLKKVSRVLIIHGNFLGEAEIEFLAAHPQFFLVHCPRSHRHFGRERFPLVDLLRRGVQVVVATDGRSSTPDLNLLAELRLVAEIFPEIAPEELFPLVTERPARALGLERKLGALTVGKEASLVVFPLRSEDKRSPYGFVWAPETRPLAVVNDGYFVDFSSDLEPSA